MTTGIAALRERLRAERAEVQAEFVARGSLAGFFGKHQRVVDRAMRVVWDLAAMPSRWTLVAVGGYGRRELYPYSDVDILVLLPGDPDPAESAALEGFVGSLWDVGVEIGHSVRTLAQCIEEAARDITVATALLESRRVTGDPALYRAFVETLGRRPDPAAFFIGKRLELEQRHEKYNDSPYSLEPNLKESPGGLRDLHVVRWVARASGIGHRWSDLAARGLVTRAEALQLQRVEHFLQRLRIHLHYVAGRREDRILFDHQNALAAAFGIGAEAHRRASEALMQRYYRNAKSVTQLSTIMLQNFGGELLPVEAVPEPINERFQAVHDLLDARDPELFEHTPHAILESFLLLSQRSALRGMTAGTLRSLWRSRHRIDAAFRADPVNRARFIEFLAQPRGIVHGLRRLNQYGLLGRYIPAFGRIVGQMQHDLFHVYTVDQHILNVVRNVRRFTMHEFAHEYPLCSRLIANFERPWLLYIAALFHDIAKGRGGDHSALGRVDVTAFARGHDLSPDDTDLVGFLVEHHLTMSTVGQKQDLADPDVIRAFADIVKTERRLVALYILTVADIRGTSPKVWNAWKGKLLEDLYRYTRRVLRGGTLDPDQDVQAKQAEALRLLRLYALSDAAKDALWKELDVGYFLRHDPQEIAWQTRNLHYRVRAPQPVVKARLSPVGEGLQVMIYCADRRELFARICGFFEGIGFNIVDAKIHTTLHGYALDTFQVLGPDSQYDYRSAIARIEHELPAALDAVTQERVTATRRISRQLKHFPIQPEVHVRPDDRGQFHVLSVTAGDRPGLLHAIARVLAKYDVDLHTAKIVTLGDRAEDVFLVAGPVLERPKRVIELETELVDALA